MKFEIDKQTAELIEEACGSAEICVKDANRTWSGRRVHFDIVRAPDPSKPWHNYENGGTWYSTDQVHAEPRNCECGYY